VGLLITLELLLLIFLTIFFNRKFSVGVDFEPPLEIFPDWEQRSYAEKFRGFHIRSLISNGEIVLKTSIF
jgi:hypothetical protein